MKGIIPFSKIFMLFALLFCLQDVAKAQIGTSDSANVFRMPVGYTNIGGQDYFGMRIQPELAFGKVGFGLDVPLFWGPEGFRDEEYRDGLGILRMVRYFRYGRKGRDPFHIKVGDLTGTTFGRGFLINNYSNAPSFERRKVGAYFDVRIKGKYGIEGLYSDFNRFNMLAIRPYARPLATSGIPILETAEVGITYLTDYTPQQINEEAELVDTRFVRKGVNAISADFSLSVLQTSLLSIEAYAQFAHIFKSATLSDSVDAYLASANAANAIVPNTIPVSQALQDGRYTGGSGISLGIQARANFVANVFQMEARLERLWYNDHFMPQFFDAVYEINKDAKLWQLANATGINGVYGTLSATVLNKVQVSGGLQIPDIITEETPALVFVNLNADEIIPKVLINGSYIKGGLANLEDAFTLDERSLANLRVAYRVNKFLVAGVDYRWTFAKVEENGQETFKATEYVMPYVGFNYPLDDIFGGGGEKRKNKKK